MTDNEATRTTFVRTRPALHEDEDEADAMRPRLIILASRPHWPRVLNIPGVEMKSG